MKLTLKMLKDLGVCDGAYAYCENLWLEYGEYEASYDYDFGMALVLSRDDFRIAAENGGPGHETYDGWIRWFDNLKYREDAITYFGDHIDHNLYETSDKFQHESLQAAKDHNKRIYDEIRYTFNTLNVINGVYKNEKEHEVWEKIEDINTADLSKYESFVWNDYKTGLNHYTPHPTEALLFASMIDQEIEEINIKEQQEKIVKKISDESGKYSIWVEVK